MGFMQKLRGMYRKRRIAGAIVAAALAAQNVSAGTLEEFAASKGMQVEATNSKEKAEAPVKEGAKKIKAKKIKAGWSLNLASSYVARPGFVPVDGPVLQSSVNARKGDLSGFVWQNSDAKAGKVTEIDVGANYHLGTFRIGPQLWIFPQAGANKVDAVLEAGVHHSGTVEADATASYLVGQGKTEDGLMLRGTVAKPIPFGKGRVIPSLTVAHLDNFYGVSGLAYATVSVSYERGIGPVTASLTAAYQSSLHPKIQDELLLSVGVRGNF